MSYENINSSLSNSKRLVSSYETLFTQKFSKRTEKSFLGKHSVDLNFRFPKKLDFSSVMSLEMKDEGFFRKDSLILQQTIPIEEKDDPIQSQQSEFQISEIQKRSRRGPSGSIITSLEPGTAPSRPRRNP